MTKKTVLHALHASSGAKLVDFGGWDMPLHYGSQMEEHHAVRRDAGMFDVSHMTVVDITGIGTKDFLRYLLANDIAKLKQTGRALYSCMLKSTGSVIDDLIVYYLADDRYRLVVNCATREKDLAWISEQAKEFDVQVNQQNDVAIIAIQGPQAVEKTLKALSLTQAQLAAELKPFSCVEVEHALIARTGYTGEDGFEIILPNEDAVAFWQRLNDSGVPPCGLGARDTLRLEAGMNLYGQDMDETVSPLVSGLGWTIALEPQDRNFIGKDALLAEKQSGIGQRLVGLVLEGKGVLRAHQKVILHGLGEGETTSGGFSPTLGHAIAFARIPVGDYESVQVEIRNKLVDVRVVKLPFVRNGKKQFV